MSTIQAGTVVKMQPDTEMPYGYFLTNGRDRVLLHNSEMTDDFDPDQELEVFLFQDHDGRMAATMRIPKVQIGKYDWVEVVGVNEELGVFVSIGMSKDILIYHDDLPIVEAVWPAVGDRLYCTLKLDRNGRLLGKLATEDVMSETFTKATKDDFNRNITGVVYRTLRTGTFIITAEGYRGFIHESERQKEPRLGQKVDGRIIDVKEDGSVNISLRGRKHEAQIEDSEKIYHYLESRGGSMPYSDKSLPEEIQKRFGLSKGAFKRALGKLMKEEKVYQENGWTHKKSAE
ncbi:putative RNA-binding protein (virulence factor B family) [Oikeobacillus pervagus]|uniref:RNA-binding protein (Virulence factor B family) n=1 Tax=Oikeobacillus pervagus TaxID=1325931 RepID=A0AAJ1T5W4_9BACI|nr:S1-like domain-containing RNA-binding protein [Oikeobacillus pervagus]MDQ0215285.1 putative RNA-binding protein (virulence factor B family) [Oikeobacillus pervagus]